MFNLFLYTFKDFYCGLSLTLKCMTMGHIDNRIQGFIDIGIHVSGYLIAITSLYKFNLSKVYQINLLQHGSLFHQQVISLCQQCLVTKFFPCKRCNRINNYQLYVLCDYRLFKIFQPVLKYTLYHFNTEMDERFSVFRWSLKNEMVFQDNHEHPLKIPLNQTCLKA